MIYILAGNMKQAKEWCIENGTSIYERKKVYVIHSEKGLYGRLLHKYDRLVRVGTYTERKDLESIEKTLHVMCCAKNINLSDITIQ